MEIWKNPEAVWDTDSDPGNPGWVVKVEEQEGDGEFTPMTYAPPPSHYHAPSSASKDKIIRATAKWEGAKIQ